MLNLIKKSRRGGYAIIKRPDRFGDMEDDLKLIKKIANSDLSAFNELMDRYYDVLLGFAVSILKDEQAAQDIVQEIFAKMWEQRAKLADVKSLRNYLYVSIKNTSINYMRAEKRLDRRNRVADFGQNENTEFMAIDVAVRLLDDAIHELPERSATVIKLTLQGLSLAEIATRMGVSQNTVRSTKAYAINKLRGQFERNHTAATLLSAISDS